MSPDTIANSIFRENPFSWWETYGFIQPKTGPLTLARANYLQRKLAIAVDRAKRLNIPLRIILLKPRQKGSSTGTVALLYHDLCCEQKRGFIVGGEHFHPNNLFRILWTYAANDKYFGPDNPCEVSGGDGDHKATWANGSECGQGTARNKNAGVSGTFQWFVCTEVALWAEEGVSDAKEVLSNALKTVPFAPGTAIVLESTARGESGAFYDRWLEAQDIETAGDDWNGYVRIFAPWFAFEDSSMPFKNDEQRRDFVATLNPDDLAEQSEWRLTDEQMQWRAWAIREECGGDDQIFERDYPKTWRTAFQKSGLRRFNAKGLKKLRQRMAGKPPTFGTLAFQERQTRVTWAPAPDAWEANVWIYEHPRPGFSYLVSVDTMTGAQANGKDPDHHGALVIRAGCFDKGKWCPPAVVARLASKAGKETVCRWDIDVVANEVRKLAMWYGGCLVVPEENNDRGLIELLKQHPVNILKRPVFNRVDNEPRDVFGWKTTVETRGHVVEAVAKAVREIDVDGSGIECSDEWLIGEMENAVIKQNGKVEAADGWHDDQWFSLGIALCNVSGATQYVAPVRAIPRWEREDLQEQTTAGTWH